MRPRVVRVRARGGGDGRARSDRPAGLRPLFFHPCFLTMKFSARTRMMAPRAYPPGPMGGGRAMWGGGASLCVERRCIETARFSFFSLARAPASNIKSTHRSSLRDRLTPLGRPEGGARVRRTGGMAGEEARAEIKSAAHRRKTGVCRQHSAAFSVFLFFYRPTRARARCGRRPVAPARPTHAHPVPGRQAT